MVLRKCPLCREIVGAESLECPRCGVSFKAALFRKVIRWAVIVILTAWLVNHYWLKLM